MKVRVTRGAIFVGRAGVSVLGVVVLVAFALVLAFTATPWGLVLLLAPVVVWLMAYNEIKSDEAAGLVCCPLCNGYGKASKDRASLDKTLRTGEIMADEPLTYISENGDRLELEVDNVLGELDHTYIQVTQHSADYPSLSMSYSPGDLCWLMEQIPPLLEDELRRELEPVFNEAQKQVRGLLAAYKDLDRIAVQFGWWEPQS